MKQRQPLQTPLLNKFLLEASRGLWGKKRLEVQEELTAHVLERAYRHEIAGLGYEDAVVKAIAELGDAKTIRSGMIGVYTMPNLLKASGVLTILVAGAIAYLGVSRAQITISERMPVKQCQDPQQRFFLPPLPSGADNINATCDSGLWVSVEVLQRTLEPMGVKFRRDTRIINNAQTPQNPKPHTLTIKQLVMDFPNFLQVRLPYQDEMDFLITEGKWEKVKFVEDVVFIAGLMNSLQQGGGSITMAGWDNPGIRYGGIRFTLGTKESPVRGNKIYPSLMYSALEKEFQGWTSTRFQWADAPNWIEDRIAPLGIEPFFRNHKHTIQTTLTQGRIVAVVSLEEARKIVYQDQTRDIPRAFRAYLVPIGADGTIEYPSDAKTLRFSSQLKDLQLSQKDKAGNVVVLHFTGDLGAGKNRFDVLPAENFSK
jgi:hypothetical protein